jgi:Peptidase family M48
MPRQILIATWFCVSWLICTAQQQGVYTYQQLSNVYYAAQKDSLKKAWVCPDAYLDRAVQKKFREIWDERTEFLTAAIEKQHFLYEPEVYSYLQAIVDQIMAASPQRFSAKPLLLIDRSPDVNAYALGSNVLVVNLGLICFSQTREELALALAHELSHNLLTHPENGMREMAEWLKSDDYKNSLKEVLDSKYGRYSRLRKVFEGYSFSRSKHQRYHESDADSLAVVLLKNSQMPFKAAYFLRLDSADIQYRRPLKKPLRDYFAAYDLPVEDGWMQVRTRGLSTKSYDFDDAGSIEDSLKTHPDCIERYKKTSALSDVNAATTPIPAAIVRKVTKMLIWNMFDDMTLTACLYRILQQKDNGDTDEWYDFMLYNIFAGLYYQDKELHRFNAIGIKPKEYISKEYYQLQAMLEQMPAESLRQYCSSLQQAAFWNHRPADEKAMKDFVTSLSATSDNAEKVKRNAAAAFISGNSTSMYCEFADQFKKK